MKFFSGKNWLKKLESLWQRRFSFWIGMPSHMRIALGVIVPIAIFAILTPTQEASANIITDAAYFLISKFFFGISWMISMIGGIILSVLAWVAEIVLKMSTQVVNSLPVRSGFPVVLAVTNMGFVAAVIVIAIATILRYGEYAIKKTLPKLIAAALLVNFSLVFAGAILNFADQFTIYFLRQISPAGEDTGFVNFASAIAGAFNPQRDFLSKGDDLVPGKQLDGMALGEDVGSMIIPITAASLTTFTMLAILLTMIAFIALLLIRYVYLVVLLIVMPFVWLMWIFPSTKKFWSQWWDKFLKQVFFAPVVVFFLYLAILTAGAMSEPGGSGALGTTTNITDSTTGSAVADFFGGMMVGSIQNFLNSLVIVGLMFGGMIAASKIGAAGASVAQKAVIGGTGAIGWGLHTRTPGALRRWATTGAIPGSSAPEKPKAFSEKGILGKIAHPFTQPFKWAGYGAKKAVFTSGAAVSEKYEKKNPKGWLETAQKGEKELRGRAKEEGIKDKDFDRGVRPKDMGGWMIKETFGKIFFKTTFDGFGITNEKLLEKFGIKAGHISAEEIAKRGIEVHAGHGHEEDHDEDKGGHGATTHPPAPSGGSAPATH